MRGRCWNQKSDNFPWQGGKSGIPINDNESSNVLSGIKIRVNTCHDEPHNPLRQDASNQSIFRSNPIAQESTNKGARDVEAIDNCRPAKTDPQWVRVSDNEVQPRTGVNAKGVGEEVVNEPDGRDGKKTLPIEADNQHIWVLCHFLAVVLLWFLQLRAEREEDDRRDDCDAQTDTPCGSQVSLRCNQDNDHRNQCANCEAHVDHKICGEDEPSVAVPGLEFCGSFRGGDTAGGIFSSNSNTDQKTVCGEGCKHASKSTMCTV